MALRSSTRQGLSKFNSLQRAEEIVGNSPIDYHQAAQDKSDEEKKREAIRTLVQTWLDSLQLISLINTFFVATEASWLVLTIPSPTDHADLSRMGQLANIGIMSALIVHVHAAIISFLAAFGLIRHKLVVAQNEEEKAEHNFVHSLKLKVIPKLNDPEKARRSQTGPHANDLCQRVRVNSLLSDPIWSTNPHLVQVGPFQGPPPTELLTRCHSLCVFFTFLGFLLALIGSISFTWDRLPRSIGIATSISTVFCIIAAILMFIVPSTNNSHIFLQV